MYAALPGRSSIAAVDLSRGIGVKVVGGGNLNLTPAGEGDTNVLLTLSRVSAGQAVDILANGQDGWAVLGVAVEEGDLDKPLAVVDAQGRLGPWDGTTGAAIAIARQTGGVGAEIRVTGHYQFPAAAEGSPS